MNIYIILENAVIAQGSRDGAYRDTEGGEIIKLQEKISGIDEHVNFLIKMMVSQVLTSKNISL
jgi:hypothetical protein